jgi:NAD+ kinase
LSSKGIVIFYRGQTPPAVKAAHELALWLKKKNIPTYTGPDQKKIPATILMKNKSSLKKVSHVIVLGGDGTYLRASRMTLGLEIPILGFNMGSLGFLTTYSANQLFDVVEKALKNQISYSHRSALQVRVFRKDKIHREFNVLNDVVLERGSYSQLINCAMSIEKELVNTIRADGFIVSTPTGSTAYNLSAGGPLLHPEAKVFVVTPVAPHSLTSRPLIFPDDQVLCLQIQGENVRAHLIVDGQRELEIGSQDEIHIVKSKFKHPMAKASVHNFFLLLREKLKFGDR